VRADQWDGTKMKEKEKKKRKKERKSDKVNS
jgi:hypothetical protein